MRVRRTPSSNSDSRYDPKSRQRQPAGFLHERGLSPIMKSNGMVISRERRANPAVLSCECAANVSGSFYGRGDGLRR